ncbi:MAG: chemotaxis protein CheX [Gammaproteobacteria bacterium]|nr:chemotaxis protein CheX [Gammaproteobacteria bacterium]
MSLAAEDIIELTQNVWSSMLKMDLAFCDAAPDCESVPEPRCTPASWVVSSVEITGEWNGTVFLACTARFAERSAATMFDCDAADMEPGDVYDALGEMVNMVGGNIKAVLPPPCRTSLPTVIEVPEFDVEEFQGELRQELTFEHDGERLTVAILQRDAD